MGSPIVDQLDWDKSQGLLPVVIQEANSGRVLMLGYMNAEALQKTIDEGRVTFWSRSKKRLWTKGESSGHFLNCESIEVDCDKDTILIQAQPMGPTCHQGSFSCFGEEQVDSIVKFDTSEAKNHSSIEASKNIAKDRVADSAFPSNPINSGAKQSSGGATKDSRDLLFLGELDQLLAQRYRDRPDGSYTTSLFEAGIDRMAQKVGEEAVETVIAAKNNDEQEFLGESADLVFHLLVLLRAKGYSLKHIVKTLRDRHGK